MERQQDWIADYKFNGSDDKINSNTTAAMRVLAREEGKYKVYCTSNNG
jgi:hypothetical protein